MSCHHSGRCSALDWVRALQNAPLLVEPEGTERTEVVASGVCATFRSLGNGSWKVVSMRNVKLTRS